MPSVFISYRRDDSAGFAGRLADALEQRLGAGAVFRDIDDIQPGADFEAVIARGLDQVRAVLVVIGPGWLDAAVDGQRRLDRADDFVRREVEQALASGKPVVPVLVGGATMPAANALPVALRGLANRQALVLGDASWSADLARLEAVLAQWVAPPAVSVSSPRRRWLAAVVVAGVAIAGALLWSTRAPGPETIVGQWTAEVAYPWNLTLEEGYDFSVRDGRIEGQASFLGAPRALEDVEWRDGRLRFVTRAGPEIGVASTKAFTTQLASLYLLTLIFAKLRGRLDETRETQELQALRHVPVAVGKILELEPRIQEWAEHFAMKHDALFLGRGRHYPIALEGALKLKEISYIHAEAYPAGELKHGPLALVDKDMPVIAVAPNDALLEKLKSNLQEVRARGGELYVFADGDSAMEASPGVHLMHLPEHYGQLSALLHVVPLQLLAYHVALVRGTDVDKPRNLAKSVTVE